MNRGLNNTQEPEIRIQVYGHDHPDVASSKFNMGMVYEKSNDMDMAHELFLESQQI